MLIVFIIYSYPQIYFLRSALFILKIKYLENKRSPSSSIRQPAKYRHRQSIVISTIMKKASTKKQAKGQPSNVKEDFNSLFERSKELKDEANQDIKASLDRALDKYHKALKMLLKDIPKLVVDKEQFVLDWKIALTPDEEKQARELFAIIFSNSSLIYFEKKKPLIGFLYANFSLWCNEAFFKANLRRAKAMIELLYVHDAEELLQSMKVQDNTNQFEKEINTMVEEAATLSKEYSSPDKIIQFLTNQLDWSMEKTYKGFIKVVDIPGRGRGVVASKNISRGETLIIEKGIIYQGSEQDFCHHFLVEVDSREDVKALYMNLFSCEESPIPNEYKENTEARQFAKSKKQWKNFTPEEIDSFFDKVKCYTYKVNDQPGLFPHMCLFNHSCDPNTVLWTLNDMALMLAQRDIKEGEEIFISYISPMNNKAVRRAYLLKYGFKCECPRCQETGSWKEKESRLMGLRCPKCGTEISCDDDGKYICTKDDWCCDSKQYKDLDEETKNALDDLAEWADKKDETKFQQAQETLQKVEKQFGHYHHNRAYALRVLAKYHAYRREEKGFEQLFNEVVKVAEFFPNPEIRTMITGLLFEIYLNFGRAPQPKELEPFSIYGMSLDVMQGFWNKSVGGGK